ncbi:MAG: hypothetical protein HYZ17_14165 [Betaproteobacteria bacterium]|nr:hypothetical protein [Betaproteobacteria bacterium]
MKFRSFVTIALARTTIDLSDPSSPMVIESLGALTKEPGPKPGPHYGDAVGEGGARRI